MEEFLRNLRLSHLLTPDQWKGICDEAGMAPDESASLEAGPGEATASQRPDVAQLSTSLIERGLVTPWHIEKLLEGKRAFFLGRYKLLECIGTGGMGAVFKAVHVELGRVVAIKMLSKEVMKNRQAVARFRKEIQTVAALDHPNIVGAYDAGNDKGVHYLVMEYVEGHDLGSVVRESGPLPVELACECIRQAAKGLQSAHEKGMVHRDIKPTNLLLAIDAESGAPHVKILDLGMARFVTETVKGGKDGSLTLLGQFLGTPDYISPEQALDTRNADIRSDIFSLGCTLFRLLTGELAWPGETVFEKLHARQTVDARSVRSLRDDVPDELDAVVARMLARDPALRYQTPREVASALAPFARRSQRIVVPPAAIVGEHRRPRTPQEDSRLDEFLKSLAAGETRASSPAPRPATRMWKWPVSGWLAAGGIALLALALFWPRERKVAPENARRPHREDAVVPIPNSVPGASSRRRGRLEELARRVEWGAGSDALSAEGIALRNDLLSFVRENATAGQARDALRLAARLTWPLDLLDERRTGISDLPFLKSSADTLGSSRFVPVAWFGDGRLTFWDAVTAIACRQDGQLLAGASRDGTVQVFDSGGTRLHTIVPPAVPGELAFQPGGEILAIAGMDGPVTLWNAEDGTQAATLADTSGPLAFSRDGALLATGAALDEITIWSAGKGTRHEVLRGHSHGELRGLRFSDDGKILASWGTDGTVALWDVGSGHERHRFANSQRPFFSPDATFVAVGGLNGDLVLRDTRTGETRRTLDDGGDPLAFLNAGTQLVSRRPGRAILWDLASGEEIRTIVEVPELAIVSGDERWLAGGDDTFAELRIWSLKGTQPRKDLSIAGPVTALAADSLSTIVVGTRNHRLQALDAVSGTEITPKCERRVPADLSPDNRLIALAQESAVVLIDVINGKPVLTIPANIADLESLSFSPDGRLLAGFGGWGFFRTSLRLWDTSDGRELSLGGDAPGTVQSLAFSPDSKHLALAGDSRLVSVWDTTRLDREQTLDDFSERVTSLGFHPDGRHLAVACQDRTVTIWDVERGSRSKELTQNVDCRQLVWSPEGGLIAGSAGHRVFIWRSDRRGEPCELATGESNALSLAFDPGGGALIAAGDDGALRHWSEPSRERRREEPDEVLQVGPRQGIVRRVIWSIDGRHVVTVNGNGTVYVLKVRTQ